MKARGQRSIDRSELYLADEAFYCGSSARITPILSIDKRPLGNGRLDKLSQQLQDHYSPLQHGTVTDEHGWLISLQSPLLQ